MSAAAILQSVRLQETPADEWARLVQLVDRAMVQAGAWSQENDPSAAERSRYSRFRADELPAIRKAAEALLKQIRSPNAVGHFDRVAFRATTRIRLTGELLRGTGLEYSRERQSVAGPFVEHLIEALVEEAQERHEPRISGRILGPLKLPGDVPRNAPDPRVTGLMFELTWLLRRYTAGLPTREIHIDDTLPDLGRPLWEVAGGLCAAALPTVAHSDVGQRFRKVIRTAEKQGGRVRWLGWRSSGYSHGLKRPEGYWGDDQ